MASDYWQEGNETLSKRLTQGPLPIEQVLRVSIEIADALDRIHRQGQIRGDLNPQNILTTGGAVALRTLNWVRGGTEVLGALDVGYNARGSARSTLEYLAPEQLESKQADARTDIFALGAVIFEMATGQKAFAGDSNASLTSAILTSEPPPMTTIQPSIPPALERVVKTCLAKDPEERWQTARDLLRELKWMTNAYAQSLPAKEEVLRKKRERTLWATVAVVLFALGLVSGILYLRRPPVQTGLKRFVLSNTNIRRFLPGTVGLEISPDGQRLLMEGDDNYLWLRPFNSLNAQRLMGTETALAYCWSPDSRFIIFAKQNKLMRIEIAKGGPPQTICNTSEYGEGMSTACNREEIVLFGGKRIWKVSADGGSPSPATELDETSQEIQYLWPCFLPDGRHFLYVRNRKNPEKWGVYLGSLESKKSTSLLDDIRSKVIYAQPGYLLYEREGRLLAHAFDATRLIFTADPVPVVDRLYVGRYGADVTGFSVSDTGTFLYVTDSMASRQLIRVDRKGRKMESIGPPGDYNDVELSPDGKQVAVTQGRAETRNAEIWTMDLRDGRKTQITTSARVWDWVPRWSPDGHQILFSSNRDNLDFGESGGNLYVKQLAGSQGSETPVLRNNQYKNSSDWSPDGRYILYHDHFPPAHSVLWLLPLCGERKPAPQLESALDGRFSPDMRWIAYETVKADLVVRPFPLSKKKWQISTRYAMFPLWRKDGKELFYAEIGQLAQKGLESTLTLVSVDVKTGNGPESTFVAGPPRVLFEIPPIHDYVPGSYQYAASRDGQSFYVLTETTQNLEVQVVLNWKELLRKK